MPQNAPTLPEPYKELESPIGLFVKVEADRARNSALSVLGIMAVIAGLLSFFGVNALVQAAVREQVNKMSGEELARILDEARDQLETIRSINSAIGAKGVVLISAANECPDGWTTWEAGQGRFVRGLDPTGRVDPEGASRLVGDPQTDTTAMPKRPFDVQSDGGHTHNITGTYANGVGGDRGMRRGNGDANADEYNDSKGVSQAGSHSHTIRGGDPETRPKNVAVLFCIRK